MMLHISIKFYENILNSFQVMDRTQVYHCQISTGESPKLYGQELRFLCSARRLMMLYICMKFVENILNGFQVIERTQFCDRWMDRQPWQKQYVSIPFRGWGGGGHNKPSTLNYVVTKTTFLPSYSELCPVVSDKKIFKVFYIDI